MYNAQYRYLIQKKREQKTKHVFCDLGYHIVITDCFIKLNKTTFWIIFNQLIEFRKIKFLIKEYKKIQIFVKQSRIIY